MVLTAPRRERSRYCSRGRRPHVAGRGPSRSGLSPRFTYSSRRRADQDSGTAPLRLHALRLMWVSATMSPHCSGRVPTCNLRPADTFGSLLCCWPLAGLYRSQLAVVHAWG